MSFRNRSLAAALALALSAPLAQAESFTFQGYVENAGSAINGSADLKFRVYPAASGGTQLGNEIVQNAWPVADGVFTIDLDAGSALLFDGAPRFLEVEVNGQILSPRLEILPAPLASSANALRGRSIAASAPGAGQVLAWNGSAWAPTDAATGGSFSAGAGLALSAGTFSILPGYRLPQGCSNDQLARWSGGAWVCDADSDTIYSADIGLGLSGTQFSLASTYRLPQGCGNNELAKWNGSAWNCAADGGTSYTAGAGLSLSAGGELSVAFGPDGTQDTASRSDHDHYGQTWSGNTDYIGFRVESAHPDTEANAITGRYQGPAVRGTGVRGESLAADGIGVQGAGSTGVRGMSPTNAPGSGVLGWRTQPGGSGVEGLADGDASTIAVLGSNNAASGVALWGVSQSLGLGAGVGVHGESHNIGGVGVRGVAISTTGDSVGVRARAFSPAGLALQAENVADDATTARITASGGGATVGLLAQSLSEDPDALAMHAMITSAGAQGTALFAEHRGGGVAIKLDGVLRMTPRGAPAGCEIGDLYVDGSAALCFCFESGEPGRWEQINGTGACP